MKDLTYIIQHQKIILTLEGFLSPSKAIIVARGKGILEKFEVQHALFHNHKKYVIKIWFINISDKITAEINILSGLNRKSSCQN